MRGYQKRYSLAYTDIELCHEDENIYMVACLLYNYQYQVFFLLKIYIYTFRNQQRTYTQVQFYTRRQFSYYTGREREKVDEKITNTNRDWFHGFL